MAESAEVVGDAGEEFFFFFVLDDDGGLDKNQQGTLVFDRGFVGEEAADEGNLGEDGYAGLDLGFADEALAADEEGASVGDADGSSDGGDVEDGELNGEATLDDRDSSF